MTTAPAPVQAIQPQPQPVPKLPVLVGGSDIEPYLYLPVSPSYVPSYESTISLPSPQPLGLTLSCIDGFACRSRFRIPSLRCGYYLPERFAEERAASRRRVERMH